MMPPSDWFAVTCVYGCEGETVQTDQTHLRPFNDGCRRPQRLPHHERVKHGVVVRRGSPFVSGELYPDPVLARREVR